MGQRSQLIRVAVGAVIIIFSNPLVAEQAAPRIFNLVAE
jgi:hypothetical protein